ncbi:MAG TPA: hypothetical protein VLC91_10635 [Spongiibacteraceae bacterium]|nr:hypothetical protein [Spongiibacteraceae bacterium]
MPDNWPSLLAELGAQLTDLGDVVFPGATESFATLDSHTVIMPLAQYGFLSVQGPESAKFLQGQLTCNVLEVDAARSTPGAYCTQKGRMLASFQLVQREADHYWLRMRSDLLENSLRMLSKYAVFSKAKLAIRDDIAVFGLHGTGARALLQSIFGELPHDINASIVVGDSLILQRDEGGIWFECWLPLTTANTFWQRCREHCGAAGSDYWRWLTIRAGLGEVSAATAELFIPQMLDYHLNSAVSFKKGCYTGQEIIARTHYRGQVKRHLLRATCDGAAPAAGSEIIDGNGRAIGNVVDSVANGDARTELLAVLGDTDLALGTTKLAANDAVLRPVPAPGQ